MAPPHAGLRPPPNGLGSSGAVTWEQAARTTRRPAVLQRPLSTDLPPRQNEEPSPTALKRKPGGNIELLFRVALAILFVGCLSMVMGVTLLVQSLHSSVDYERSAVQSEAVASTPEPSLTREQVQEQCYNQRDHGLIQVLQTSGREFCGGNGAIDNDSRNLTTVTRFDLTGRFQATVFSSLSMDFSGARVHHPIRSPMYEGGDHDPRFVFKPHMIKCFCPELEQHALSRRRIEMHARTKKEVEVADPLRLWSPMLAKIDSSADHPSTICAPFRPDEPKATKALPVFRSKNVWRTPEEVPKPSGTINITDRAVVIARRDDHNPFFQISGAFNAWVLMKALQWSPNETQVVHLDDGYPSPIDALHQKLLGPNRRILSGGKMKSKLINFQSQVMLPPFESDGPLMLDLDNDNPCFNSVLIQDFRLEAMQALNVSADSQPQELATANSTDQIHNSTQPVIVTVITRRPYGGRRVQRVWRNEDGVLAFMRKSYANKSIVFRSVECADLSLQQQMQLMVESDVVIGMHGAGMANVLWTRPETLVLEIFPKKRKRWGYRNLCQNLGCTYRDFRGGKDFRTGRLDNANANDKHIPPEEFLAFFAPLLTQHLKTQGRSL